MKQCEQRNSRSHTVRRQLNSTVFADRVLMTSVATNPMSVTVVIKVRFSRQIWNTDSFFTVKYSVCIITGSWQLLRLCGAGVVSVLGNGVLDNDRVNP